MRCFSGVEDDELKNHRHDQLIIEEPHSQASQHHHSLITTLGPLGFSNTLLLARVLKVLGDSGKKLHFISLK